MPFPSRVLKFGGSSVGSAERIRHVAELIQRARREPCSVCVVVSALQGVTDTLIQIAHAAATGDDRFRSDAKALGEKHIEVIQALIPPKNQSAVLTQLKVWLNDLDDVLQGVSLVWELSPRTLDFIMSFGELFSAYILTQTLKGLGEDAEFLDARTVIRTDELHGAATVDFHFTNEALRAHFESHPALQVMTGFIASTPRNETITLGRGGSDYSAAIVGAALDVEVIEIWTDVDGVMTADPRKVPKAFTLEHLSYHEAMELSHFGAKVIYPPTVQPALQKKIPISIRNTFQPEFRGTIISADPAGPRATITGVSSIEHTALVLVQGSGMVGIAGISERLFGALARRNISVILISQASSEYSICVAVQPHDAERAKGALEDEFALERHTRSVDEITVERDCSIISIVGDQMSHEPGVSGRLFRALGRNGINIRAIAQGSSERNISVVVGHRDERKALNVVHDEFFLSGSRSIHLFVVGIGLIGGTFLKQLHAHYRTLKEQLGLDIRVVCIANSKKVLIREEGIPLDRYKELLLSEGQDGRVAEAVRQMVALNLPNSIFLDSTASEEVVGFYERVLDGSISIVTPNKKAQSAKYDTFRRLQDTARRRGVRLLYETSVGAGLPVISTLADLSLSGDKIHRIEAVLSGTLSFLFNTFDGSKPFSEVVREAKQRGYTEPDPRDDLNGLDVTRKLLILAREAGYTLELDDIRRESLVPPDCEQVQSVDEFFSCLQRHDGYYENLRAEAARRGEKLCYIASLEQGQATVRLSSVPPTHAFFSLSGSDNIIAFTTDRYAERPLVVKGPGAGAEVTAAGVFADVIRIGNASVQGW